MLRASFTFSSLYKGPFSQCCEVLAFQCMYLVWGGGDPVQSIILLNELFKLNKMVRLGNDHIGSSIDVASITLL